MIPYALSYTDLQGRTWHPYDIEFKSPDGTYDCHIYAISEEHAQLQLTSLKENGHIGGRVLETFSSGKLP